jgi:ferrous iron transport protein B
MDIVIADGRYGIIHGLARDVVRRDEPLRRSVSDAMDRVLLNGALGLPIFAGVMCLVFLAAMRLGAPFIEFFEKASRAVFMDGVRALLGLLPAPALLVTLVADGAGGGIRAVAALVPPVFFIFLFLAVLEDSGYMARAAFLMDHLLRRVGLPGKAFVPLLTGFGCNVPAILAARTLDDERDRLVTILINPFMSCGARFPVYTLFAVAFFPEHGPAVIFALYLTGVALALLTALALRRTLFRGEPAAFVMELPPYHLPTPGGVLHHAWRRLSGFVLRAGKVIVLFVVALTLLNSVGADGALSPSGSSDSALRQAGKRLTPLFGPMGIRRDNWPAGVGLFSGMLAKEAVVGTLDALYTQMEGRAPAAPDGAAAGVGAGLREAFMAIPRGFFPRGPGDGGGGEGGVSAGTFRELREHFGERAAAFAYLLFVLIYVPCVATIAAIRREAGPGWAAFAVAYLTGLAWVVATAYYQAATFAFHPVSSAAWLSLCAAAVAAFLAGLELRGRAMRKGMRR